MNNNYYPSSYGYGNHSRGRQPEPEPESDWRSGLGYSLNTLGSPTTTDPGPPPSSTPTYSAPPSTSGWDAYPNFRGYDQWNATTGDVQASQYNYYSNQQEDAYQHRYHSYNTQYSSYNAYEHAYGYPSGTPYSYYYYQQSPPAATFGQPTSYYPNPNAYEEEESSQSIRNGGSGSGPVPRDRDSRQHRRKDKSELTENFKKTSAKTRKRSFSDVEDDWLDEIEEIDYSQKSHSTNESTDRRAFLNEPLSNTPQSLASQEDVTPAKVPQSKNISSNSPTKRSQKEGFFQSIDSRKGGNAAKFNEQTPAPQLMNVPKSSIPVSDVLQEFSKKTDKSCVPDTTVSSESDHLETRKRRKCEDRDAEVQNDDLAALLSRCNRRVSSKCYAKKVSTSVTSDREDASSAVSSASEDSKGRKVRSTNKPSQSETVEKNKCLSVSQYKSRGNDDVSDETAEQKENTIVVGNSTHHKKNDNMEIESESAVNSENETRIGSGESEKRDTSVNVDEDMAESNIEVSHGAPAILREHAEGEIEHELTCDSALVDIESSSPVEDATNNLIDGNNDEATFRIKIRTDIFENSDEGSD